MPYKFLLILTGALASILMGISFFTSSLPSNPASLSIVCTTGMIADAAQAIAGHHAQVHGLMGPGVDPHLYKAREGDAHKLAAADIIFYNGLHLEGKMASLLQGMRRSQMTIAVGECIPANERILFDDHVCDPHIWHDVVHWRRVTTCICDALIAKDPTHADDYRLNALRYIAQLQDLHSAIEKAIASIPSEKRILITAHDAFGYFGKRYGLEVVGLQGISTDAEITLADINNLVDFVIEKKVHVVFVETSIAQKSLEVVKQAARARGWQLSFADELYSDALGDVGTTTASYIGMMQHNVLSIIKALA